MSTADIKAIATQIMRDIGAGYSEDNYQQALFNKLVKIDPAAVKERTIPIIYDGASSRRTTSSRSRRCAKCRPACGIKSESTWCA